MKQNIFKLFTLLILTLFYNCEKETINIETTESQINLPYSFNKVQLSDFQSNEKLISKLNQFSKNKSTQTREIYNSNYDFYVETDYAKYLESNDGSFHSYTFAISDDLNDNVSYNLIFSLNPDGSYSSKIARYTFNDENSYDLAFADIDINSDSYINRSNSNNFTFDCTTTVTWHNVSEPCGCPEGGNISATVVDSAETDCIANYSSSGNPYFAGDTYDSGGGGSGADNVYWIGGSNSTNNNGNNNDTSDPTVNVGSSNITSIYTKTFLIFLSNLNLTEEQQNLVDDRFDLKFQLQVLFNNVDNNDDLEAITLEIIDYLIANPDLSVEDITTLIIDSYATTPIIDDIEKELECFNLLSPAKMTIYSEQSIPGSREVTANIGHTFIGLEQNGIIRSIGFYSDSPRASLLGSQGSELHDNSNSPYDVSISIDISATQLQQIINYTKKYPDTYYLNEYNCTDFGIVIAGNGGLTLPETIGEYSGYGGLVKFKGRNPSDLGEDMRELTLPQGATRNLDGGNAPLRSSDCP